MSKFCYKSFISVAIPAYKRKDMLEKLLFSIKEKVPIIVSDNGGNLPVEFKESFPHINFVVGPEVSLLENWNRAACSTDSEWIIMPGDDDLYFADSFSRIVGELKSNPQADMVFFGHQIIDEADNVTSAWIPERNFFHAPAGFEEIKRGTPARPPGIAIRSELFHKLGGFNTNFRVTAGDNHFYQRAALIGNLAFSDEIVTSYRMWRSNATLQKISTPEWLREIDMWCAGVKDFAKEYANYNYPGSLKDNIYLDNLVYGIDVLIRRGEYLGAWKHFLHSRYPYKADFAAQIKLVSKLILLKTS